MQPETSFPASLASANQLAVAQHLLDGIQAQIRNADEKIRVLFGGTALMAAALAFSPPYSTAGGPVVPIGVVFIILHFLTLIFVAISITSAILALLPRVRRKVEPSLYFFGHIAGRPHDAFLEEFSGLHEDLLIRQILSQVHANAQIVGIKYAWTSRAATGFAIAVVLLVVKQAIAVFL